MKRLFKSILLLLLFLTACSTSKRPDPTDDNYRVFYEIFTGSFSDSNGDGIGDLQGIIDRLDYLNDCNVDSKTALGIQGIWLTPIFASPSYHKYDVVDYYRIDSSFGTQEDLDKLIEECHKRNIKLILDLVINHTSRLNDWFIRFQDAHKRGDNTDPYYSYYTYGERFKAETGKAWCDIEKDDEVYECNFSYDMPELDLSNPAVRKEVLAIAEYYIDKGIDGFRFDAAKYIDFNDSDSSIGFWKWYTDELRKLKPDIYLVGEVWSAESETDKYLQAMNCFNFSMAQAEGMIAKAAKGGDINLFTDYVSSYQAKTVKASEGRMPVSFISNHDMDRAAGYLNIANGRAFIGASLYLLSPGSPFIYYGEEIGMKGSRGSANTDANRRLAMLWGDGDTVRDPEGSTFPASKQTNGTVKDQLTAENSLYHHYKKLIKARIEYPQIARGTYRKLDLGLKNLGGFAIEYEGQTTYVVHNNSDTPIEIENSTFSKILETFGLGSGRYANGKLSVDPYTSLILK